MSHVELEDVGGESARFYDCGCLMRVAQHDDGVVRRTFDSACGWGCQASLTAMRDYLLGMEEQ